jgi:hypothetical protein
MSSIAATTYPAAVAVTKSDTNDDPHGTFAGLYVAAAGTLAFLDGSGNTVTIASPMAVGQLVAITCKRVLAAGTSATVYGLQALPWKGK